MLHRDSPLSTQAFSIHCLGFKTKPMLFLSFTFNSYTQGELSCKSFYKVNQITSHIKDSDSQGSSEILTFYYLILKLR